MKDFRLLLTVFLLFGGLFQAVGQSVPSYVPTNGLVGWWPFNGNAQDASGNGNHGTVNGPLLATDRFGSSNSAYNFDGIDDYIDAGNNINIPNYTISSWVNITQLPSNTSMPSDIVSKISTWFQNVSLQFWNSNPSYFQIQHGNSSSWVGVPSLSVVPINQWVQLTSTFNGNEIKLFINGQLESSVTENNYADIVGFTTFFGSRPNNQGIGLFNSGNVNGYIDDIGIWNRALTQQEITNLYNAQSCQVSLTTQPSNQTTGTNRNVQFLVVSSEPNSAFRWQTDMGLGFQNLTNAGQYSGVNTSTLNVSNTSPQNDNQLFRCIVSTTNRGSDTSDVVTLNVNTSSSSTGVPNKFNYQLVVRDTSGQLVTNRPVSMRLSLQRGPQMANLYIETHQLTTNSNGLLTTTIGSGQATQGMMDTIDWSGGMVYVKTEIDMTGGSNYSLVSTRELLSVPYALYSLNSGSSTPGPVGPMGPQGVPGPQGPSGVSFPAGGTSGQALFNCNGVPTWGPCPNQPTMPTVTTNPVTLLPGNSASTGGNVTSDGGSPVTHRGVVYDTTSNPNLSSNYTVDGSGAGPFVSTLNNLAPTTTYYTRAYATNSVGTAYGEVRIFNINLNIPIITLGSIYAGGRVFYLDNSGQHGLVCHTIDVGSAPWGLLNTNVIGTQTNIGSGLTNSGIITSYAVNYPSIAAFVCDTLQVNGYNDWFLPSRDELQLIYNNIHIWGLGSFQNTWYWSSSQWNLNEAWSINFNDGYVGSHPHQWVGGLQKNLINRIIAVRAF